MRKLFVAAVAVLFLGYCYIAYKNTNCVQVPRYETVQVDLLGGLTPDQWRGGRSEADIKASASFRREHLRALARRRLQPPADKPLEVGGKVFPPDESLDRDALEALVHRALETGETTVELRDPAPILALVGRDLHLRDPVWTGTGAGRRKLFDGGITLDKPAVDKLIRAGFEKVTVVGQGQPVAPQPATMAVVILIFLALVAALKDALWSPLLALVDDRAKDVEAGKQVARDNRAQEAHNEEENRKRRQENRKVYLDAVSRARHEALREADRILDEAKEKARKMREETERDIAAQVKKAEDGLRGEVPGYARDIAEQVLARAPKNG